MLISIVSPPHELVCTWYHLKCFGWVGLWYQEKFCLNLYQAKSGVILFWVGGPG